MLIFEKSARGPYRVLGPYGAGCAMGAQHSAELLVDTEGLFIRHSYSRAFLSALAYSICRQVLRTTPVQTTMAWTTMR